ncbi:LamG-like jellyroll fold domain-containing protein [Flavobacterium sp. K5-23]|uniref:LamG-like jellyroll fold domain-containing protein n=1 Tax=Flavobacterium sp. K5-23 TaxID=2746225 RepID=UPI00200D409D|nr:LamG-like jellyroll fold domain-containing protein [Flavobacterium sp. K5-23]UQD57286.1 T9SS type A sorting domain-containing protein [Flavobacterium sp. K5-23]
MKKKYSNNLLLAFSLFLSFVAFSQSNQQIFVRYGSPALNIPFNGTVNFGSSTEIEFSIINVPDGNGNPSLVLSNPEVTLNNTNFVVSSRPSDFNIKKGEVSVFRLRKNNFTCNSSAQTTIVTVHSNAKNYPSFTFNITFTNKPLISVLGGTPTQPLPNGQIIPTSATGTLFGSVTAGATATRNYVIVNTGTCPLVLQGITSLIYDPATGTSGGVSPDFSIYINPTPYPSAPGTAASNIIPVGGASYFVVLFYPQSLGPGLKSALISIPNNDLTKDPYTFVVSGEVYDPTITGPGGGNPDFRLWLKSTRGVNLTTGTNSVRLWRDLGSTGKDATQIEAVKQPTYIDATSGNINYNPVVKFQNNGTTLNQFMYNIDNGYYTHETFIVMEPDVTIDGSTSPMTIISGTSAANPSYPIISGEHSGIGFGDFSNRLTGERLWFNQWQTTTTTPYFSIGDATGNYSKAGIINTRNKTTVSEGVELLFNANEIVTPLTSSSEPFSNLGYTDTSITPNIFKGTPYNIGKNINSGTTYGNLNGRVAELISYASRVLPENRPKIETYLAIKYGITLGLNGTSTNYIDSGGKIIWESGANTGYNFNIAGIGKDIGSDLNQKQSKSSNDPNAVTIGLGVIATTNNANINEFKKDRDFLVWGSDNGTFIEAGSNTIIISTGLTTVTTRINKKWKIVETKTDVDVDVENVFVGIPVTAFSTFTKDVNEEYALIVSDNDNFNDADIIDIIPLKIKIDALGNPILNKEGSQTYETWYDFDGTKYFTFGKALKATPKEAININAAGDFLVGEYALNLNSGSFTIGCWLKNNVAVVANKTIMAKGVNLEFRLNSDKKIEALWDGVSKFVSRTVINDGLWHNVVAVYYEGSADLYIDGILDSSTFDLTNPSPNYSRYSVGALYAKKGVINTPFYGEIDEIHIWNMALTSNQINYLMNQEIEKHSDGNTKGKILPQNSPSNEFKATLWSELVAYYDFNAFYGTTVEGLTGDRNFLRIKYLNKIKNITGIQTAPLPYETVANGEWNGTNSGMWKNGDIQTIPNSSSLVTYTKDVNGSPVTFNYLINGNIVKINHNVTSVGNKTVLGLFIEGTDATIYKTLSANNNTKIQVSNYLRLDGLIDLTGRSQLVQTLNSDLDPLSIGFIKRDQQGTSNRFNYNYWSSPVGPINATTNNNVYTVAGVFKDGTTIGVPENINWVSGYDGSQSPLSLARYWLYIFKNGFSYANWDPINENSLINPAQGFTLKGAGAVDIGNTITQNYTFIGKPYNGLINGNSVLPDDLFLVGNPYPSALDAFQFIRDNVSIAEGGNNTIDIIDGTLYFWEHSSANDTHYLAGYTGGYAELTLTGGTPPLAPIGISGEGDSSKIPNQFIPVGQAFFVNGYEFGAGSNAIIFNNNQRSFVKEDGVDDIPVSISNTMYKSTANKNKDHFSDNSNDIVYNNYNTKIRLGFNATNKLHRQLLIGFMNEEATDGVDAGYDGYQLDTQDNDAYFLINDLEYSIQGVGAFDASKTYPLGVKMDTKGTVQFMVDDVEFLPSNVNIYIHDKTASVFYNITKQAVDFNLESGDYNSRFELAFKIENQGTAYGNGLPETSIMVYNLDSQNILNIVNNSKENIKEVSIYNVLGQRLIAVDNTKDTNSIKIPFNVQKGLYIVKIVTDTNVVSKKVIKK